MLERYIRASRNKYEIKVDNSINDMLELNKNKIKKGEDIKPIIKQFIGTDEKLIKTLIAPRNYSGNRRKSKDLDEAIDVIEQFSKIYTFKSN